MRLEEAEATLMQIDEDISIMRSDGMSKYFATFLCNAVSSTGTSRSK